MTDTLNTESGDLSGIEFSNLKTHNDFKSVNSQDDTIEVLCICGHKYLLNEVTSCIKCKLSHKQAISKTIEQPIPTKKTCISCGTKDSAIFSKEMKIYNCLACGHFEEPVTKQDETSFTGTTCDECGLESLSYNTDLGMYQCVSCSSVEEVDQVKKKVLYKKSKQNLYEYKSPYLGKKSYTSDLIFNPLYSMPPMPPSLTSNPEKMEKFKNIYSQLLQQSMSKKGSNGKSTLDVDDKTVASALKELGKNFYQSNFKNQGKKNPELQSPINSDLNIPIPQLESEYDIPDNNNGSDLSDADEQYSDDGIIMNEVDPVSPQGSPKGSYKKDDDNDPSKIKFFSK